MHLQELAMGPTVLVIGIGNTLRRDDGAGWLFAAALAERLQQAGATVHLLLQQQLTPELAIDAVEMAPDQIIFVDASLDVEETALTEVTPSIEAPVLDHRLDAAALLTLMRRLYAVQARSWLVQTPARDLGHGEGLSEKAQEGLRSVPAIAALLIGEG
ncbi:hydrogenase maturation protease [Caldilinea sp.]|jgi:hydrogenase maturation protease|nr:hydrogenase maturation protease [Caldilinea sp.]GIV72224.1 MAG: hydrogenase [Caldilinea sp.]